MKKFYQYLVEFIREDFQLSKYAFVGVILVIGITINYKIDLEDGIIDKFPSLSQRFISFFTLMTSAYLLTVVCTLLNSDSSYLKKSNFLITVLFGMTFLALDLALQPSAFVRSIVPTELSYFITKLASNLMSVFTFLIPLFVFHSLSKTDSQYGFYGLRKIGFEAKPYLQLFSIVIPLVIVASFFEGFQNQYPMYRTSQAHSYLGLPDLVTMLGYELAYGWNFVSIELLFRGFFVVGMIQILGRNAVLPMVVVYCFIHFGKPMGECIGSIFGGYFLGVLAYSTKNIWGGIIIHLGLAWCMEFFAALAKNLF